MVRRVRGQHTIVNELAEKFASRPLQFISITDEMDVELEKRSLERHPIRFGKLAKSFGIWWTRGDSNPRPPRCERGKFKAKTRCCNHLVFATWSLVGLLGLRR